MKKLNFYGSWWLPDHADRKVAGTISFDDSGLQLTLYGDFEDRDTLLPSGPITPSWVHRSYPIVHGIRHGDRKYVTLLDVSGELLDLPIDNFSQNSFSAEVALINGHLNDLRFLKVSFGLDYLTTWAQPPSRQVHDPDDRNTLKLQTQSIDLAATTLDGGSTITLRNGIAGTEGDSAVNLHEYCALDFVPPDPVARSVLVDRVRQGRDLITLSLGRTVRVLWVYLHGIEGGRSCEAYYPLDEPLGKDDLTVKEMRNRVFSFSSPTLLTAKESGGLPLPVSLESLLARWFSMDEKFSDALNLLLACYSTEVMLPEHRYSSLFSSIEELHKALDLESLVEARPDHRKRRERVTAFLQNEDLDEDDREWAINLVRNSRNDKSIPQKVRDLLDLSGAIGAAALKEAPQFARNSAKARGKVSHGAAGSEAHRFVRLCYELTLRWALRSIIISELLFDDPADRAAFREAASKRKHLLTVLKHLAEAEAAAAKKPEAEIAK